MGCGRGAGVQILLNRFGASTVHALDFDEEQVGLARRRLKGLDLARVQIEVGDTAHLEFANETFDAVFDFGAIHQIADWRGAIAEVRRVLRPGGRFYFEEIAWSLNRKVMRFFVQEYTSLMANPFTPAKFLSELERQGFEGRTTLVTRRLLSLTGVIGDLIGVAHRS